MAELRFEGVTKKFDRVSAVKDLSLTVSNGEFVVLLGPTGAGKTTTLRLGAGLETPDEGKVFLDGVEVTKVSPAARDVTFVFQEYSLYPHLTVFENMAFPLKSPIRKVGKSEIKKRVTEVAEMLRIGHKLKNKATQLSGGEMQRVSIGRALVRAPKVFLMDEPLSSLDAKLREDLRVELKRIQREIGATILYVTHDQLEAMTLADRIGILNEGVLEQIDAPQRIYEKPCSIYAARRLGSPQINLIDPGVLGLMPSSKSSVKLGVRPEDIIIKNSSKTNAKVLGLENLGVETVALLSVDGIQVHGLLDRNVNLNVGESVSVSVKPGRMSEFDAVGRAVV